MEHLVNESGIPYNVESIVGIKEGGDGYGVAVLGRDAALAVEFYPKHVPVLAQSNENATKFRETVYIRISKPGDKSWQVDREIKEGDKRRFPMQWAAFKNNQSQAIGHPLKVLLDRGLLTPAQYEMLKYVKMQTIEQLVNATPAIIEGFGPDGSQMQKIAKGFLKTIDVTNKAGLDIQALKEELKKELLSEMISQPPEVEPNLDDTPTPSLTPKKKVRKKNESVLTDLDADLG